MNSPAELAELALDIGREAGALVLRGRDEVRIARTKSSPIDLVTQMDQASEDLIRARIAEVRPEDAFLGEESGETDAGAGYRWVVDPIDGTVNYYYGIPAWAVSIAVERNGEVVAGVVVAPALGEEYVASLDGGSYRIMGEQRRQLHCSTTEDLAVSLVATGFGYLRERRVSQARVIADLLPDIRDIRRAGAAAIDLCWVGAGRVDASFERGLNPWDRAAGGLVATEAGAVIGGLRGNPAGEDMTLAAPPALFEKLAARLEATEADGPEEP